MKKKKIRPRPPCEEARAWRSCRGEEKCLRRSGGEVQVRLHGAPANKAYVLPAEQKAASHGGDGLRRGVQSKAPVAMEGPAPVRANRGRATAAAMRTSRLSAADKHTSTMDCGLTDACSPAGGPAAGSSQRFGRAATARTRANVLR